MQTTNPAVNYGIAAPVYYSSRDGVAYLSQELEDERYLKINTRTPNWLFLYHFVAVAGTHIMLDRAAERVAGLRITDWIGERAIANPDEKDPDKLYRLYTIISDAPRIVCVPDAAFLMEKDGFRKVFYLEQDRDTTKNAERIAAQKCQGYAGLMEKKLHLTRHFPQANVDKFTVLMIAPTERRRDNLRKAITPKPGGNLWRFTSLTELTPETFLTAPVWHSGKDAPSSLIQQKGGGT
jgi:hypothetical protein